MCTLYPFIVYYSQFVCCLIAVLNYLYENQIILYEDIQSVLGEPHTDLH